MTAVEITGVNRDQMVVIGDGIEIAGLVLTLRKKVAYTEIVSVTKVEPPKDGSKQPYKNNHTKDGSKQPYEIGYLPPMGSLWNRLLGERDDIFFDTKSSNKLKEAEIVQAEAKSRRDDNFIGESNSDATFNSENKTVIEDKKLDLRNDFVGHLVKALKKNGVNVDEFAIEESRMALVIFSSRYIESRLCLNELVKIKELMEEGKLLVLPIFYKVEPLDVKQLKGDFGVKFWDLWRINRDHHIIEWKEALKSVASIKGIYLKEHW